MSEVVTIQLGPTANTVGALYWNHVLARAPSALVRQLEGRVAPSVLCVDAKGGLGHQPWPGGVAGDADMAADALPWTGSMSRIERARDATATQWTERMSGDWLAGPRGVHVLEGVRAGLTPFALHVDGVELLSSSALELDALHDSLRWWAESTATGVGALRLLWDGNSGFGGVAEALLTYAAEEHAKADVWALPLDLGVISATNAALCWSRALPLAALALPLLAPGPESLVHAYGTLASFAETPAALASMCGAVTRGHANAAWTRLAVSEDARVGSLLRATASVSSIVTPPRVDPWCEQRFVRHIVAARSPDAALLRAQLDADVAQYCVSALWTGLLQDGLPAAAAQLGQTPHVNAYLRTLLRDADPRVLDEAARNMLELQMEDYPDSLEYT